MTIFYSNSVRGFFPASMRAHYEAAGTWPADGVEVSDEEEVKLRNALSSGAPIRLSAEGAWEVSAPPALPFSVLAEPYMAHLRQVRDDVLNRLAGIGFAAMTASDTTLVQAVLDARQALLDITVTPAIVAATDVEELNAAIKAAYLGIIGSAPPVIRDAFDPNAF